MRLIAYLKACAACALFLLLSACSGGGGNILPQATIPLPQGEDGDGDTAYLSVSTPSEDGYVEITSSDDLVPVDVDVAVQVLLQDDVIEEIDSAEVDESDEDVCETFSDLPACPDLNSSNQCKLDPDTYGALNGSLPARVSDIVVVKYNAASACETTSLAELQVDESKVSQEFTKEDDGSYAKKGEATGGSNASKDSYQKSNEYVVDVYVEKVAEDIKRQEGNTQSTTTSVEELRDLKEEIKDKVVVVGGTNTTDTSSTSTEEVPENILPVLPSSPSYFKKFVVDNFTTEFFLNTYGITKSRIYAVPFLKIINGEIVFVVGVKQPYTTLLAYYVITADVSYDQSQAKFLYAFSDYEFLIKSMTSFFSVSHLVHDDQYLSGDYLSFRDNLTRTLSLMDLDNLTIVKTKNW